MKIIRILELSGPNIWTNRYALEAWVDLGPYEERPSNLIPGFYERLTTWLPSLIEHRCSEGERGGFLSRLRDGTWLGHILEHVSLELQTQSYEPVGYGRARETTDRGIYRVVIACFEPQLGRACLATGLRLLLAAAENLPFDLDAELNALRQLANTVGLSRSARLLSTAAKKRGIPVRRLGSSDIVLLGYGCDQRRVRGADTERTAAVGAAIASDPELTRKLLRQIGVTVVSDGERANSARHDVWVTGNRVLGALTDFVGEAPARFVERVHPEIADLCLLVSRALGLTVASVELLSQDLQSPISKQTVSVVKVEATLDLPTCAKVHPASAELVAEALVVEIMPPSPAPRFRLVSVSGTNGKTEVQTRVSAMLSSAGLRTASASQETPELVAVASESTSTAELHTSVEQALMNPLLDAAVVEISEVGVLECGAPFDTCDVAVVTNLGSGDHLGRRYLQDLEFARKAIRTPVDVVHSGGWAVLNAEDEAVRALAQYCKGQVVYFSACALTEALRAELGKDARVVFVKEQTVYLEDLNGQVPLLSPPGVSLEALAPFELANRLAATAVGWALSLPAESVNAAWGERAEASVWLESKKRRVCVSNCRNLSALDANLHSWREAALPKSLAVVLTVQADWRAADIEVLAARSTAWHRLAIVADSETDAQLTRPVMEALVDAVLRAGQPAVSRFEKMADALASLVGADDSADVLVQTGHRAATAEWVRWLELHPESPFAHLEGRSEGGQTVGPSR